MFYRSNSFTDLILSFSVTSLAGCKCHLTCKLINFVYCAIFEGVVRKLRGFSEIKIKSHDLHTDYDENFENSIEYPKILFKARL